MPQPNFIVSNPVSPQVRAATPPIISINPPPISMQPNQFGIGQIWVDSGNDSVYVLTSIHQGVPFWLEVGIAGNIFNVVGGSNITVNTVAGTATVNLDNNVHISGNFQADGTVIAGTDIESNAGNIKALNGSFQASDNVNDSTSSVLLFTKSRLGGVITTGDGLGQIQFTGDDGVSAAILSAAITVETTGTIAAGRVPSTMSFATTPDSVSATVERVIIDQNGTVNIEATTSSANAI